MDHSEPINNYICKLYEMGVISKITKEYFGEEKRDEEKVIFNTNKYKPVYLDGSVLWADINLEVESGGNYRYNSFFTGEEMLSMKFEGGWRVPTYDEYRELFKKGIIHKIIEAKGNRPFEAKVVYTSTHRSDTLVFNETGFYHIEKKEKIRNGGYAIGPTFTMWTSTIDKIYDGDGNEDVAYKLINTFNAGGLGMKHFGHSKSLFLPIRLVMDKG